LIADYAGYFAIPPAAPCVTNCLYAWGCNQSGQLGIGNHRWDSLTPRHVHGLSDVKAVATGFLSGFALRGDGTVWGWGYNEWGQLGGWFGGQSAVPVRIHGLDGITAIGDGIAVRTGGTLWTWARKALSSASGTPVQVPGLTGITAVASGVDTSYALSSDGTVWTWGVNHLGELGNGTVGGFSNVPVQVPGLTGVNAISANNLQRFAVLSDGTVRGWGNNQYGALGNGQECSDSCAVPTPGRVVGLTTARTVAANTGGGYAVDTDGRVWAWGSGLGPVEGGQPGHSTTPLRQTAPTAVSAVAGGSGSGFAIAP
jgi:alpha-tubulin suppressor-like RCC1 family protein